MLLIVFTWKIIEKFCSLMLQNLWSISFNVHSWMDMSLTPPFEYMFYHASVHRALYYQRRWVKLDVDYLRYFDNDKVNTPWQHFHLVSSCQHSRTVWRTAWSVTKVPHVSKFSIQSCLTTVIRCKNLNSLQQPAKIAKIMTDNRKSCFF